MNGKKYAYAYKPWPLKEKWCPVCARFLDIKHFSIDLSTFCGYKMECKPCQADRQQIKMYCGEYRLTKNNAKTKKQLELLEMLNCE